MKNTTILSSMDNTTNGCLSTGVRTSNFLHFNLSFQSNCYRILSGVDTLKNNSICHSVLIKLATSTVDDQCVPMGVIS